MAGWINLLFFTFFSARALLSPALNAYQRKRIIRTGVLGIVFSMLLLLSQRVTNPSVLTYVADWLPTLLMLLAYWQTGHFFTQPQTTLQAKLEAFDRAVFERLPSWRAEQRRSTHVILWYLELAYLCCYLLIPLGVGTLYLARMRSEVDAYWSIVLPAAYSCYAVTAFFHTLPPRSLQPEESCPFRENKMRALNHWIVHHASIQINTFPSAHVAATTAASLALWHASPVAAGVFLWISLSIAIATVVCRYHFVADALAGFAVAVFSFFCYALLT